LFVDQLQQAKERQRRIDFIVDIVVGLPGIDWISWSRKLKDVPELTSLTTILISSSLHQQVKIWSTLFTTIPICVPLDTN
jgi:hypothetical protein